MSATAASDVKDEGAAITAQPPTTEQKDQPTDYPAPPKTTNPEYPAAETASMEARAQEEAPPQTTPPKDNMEVASKDGDAGSNATDERANKADEEDALEDTSGSTASACQAPWAHMHPGAHGKVYIKALGNAPRLSKTSATQTKAAASLEETTATEAAQAYPGDPYVELNRQWYKMQNNKAMQAAHEASSAYDHRTYTDLVDFRYGKPQAHSKTLDETASKAPSRPKDVHTLAPEEVFLADAEAEATHQQAVARTVADGGELCNGCGYALCDTRYCRRLMDWIQLSDNLRIQGEFYGTHNCTEWTTSGEEQLLASASTTVSTTRIPEPLKDLLPNDEELNKKEDPLSSNEDEKDEILPIQ